MALSPSTNWQYILRDLMSFLQARGLRHAAHAGNTATDEFRVFKQDPSAAISARTGISTTGKSYFVIELDDTTMDAMDEKAIGGIHPHVPDTTRQ